MHFFPFPTHGFATTLRREDPGGFRASVVGPDSAADMGLLTARDFPGMRRYVLVPRGWAAQPLPGIIEGRLTREIKMCETTGREVLIMIIFIIMRISGFGSDLSLPL